MNEINFFPVIGWILTISKSNRIHCEKNWYWIKKKIRFTWIVRRPLEQEAKIQKKVAYIHAAFKKYLEQFDDATVRNNFIEFFCWNEVRPIISIFAEIKIRQNSTESVH